MRTTTRLPGTVQRYAAAAGRSAMLTFAAVWGMAAAMPPALAAATVGRGSPFAIERDARRLRLTAPLDGERTVVGGRVDSSMVLHRFRIVATDRSGAAIAAADDRGGWAATVLVTDAGRGAGATRPLVHLSSRSSDFTLPRPLGFRLEAGDSLELRVIAPSSSRDVALHLVVDFEGGSALASRLAVSPMPARGWEQAGEASKFRTVAARVEWSWTPDQSGRLLAIAGVALASVREAVLEDAATGERLWSATLRDTEGRSVFGTGSDVVRLGVSVQAGRTYRLRTTRWSSSDEMPSGGELLALVLPAGAR